MAIRYHEIPGYDVSFPAVTSLIELFNEYKFINSFIPKSENRANIGTQAHDIIARINQGGHIEKEEWNSFNSDIQNAVTAFIRWKKATGFKPRLNEQLLYSLKYGIAGHVDSIGTIKRSVGVFDWKLGDIYNIRVKYQISVYGFLYLEMFPSRTLNEGFRAVHLDSKTATYDEIKITMEEAEQYFNEFIKFKQEVGII